MKSKVLLTSLTVMTAVAATSAHAVPVSLSDLRTAPIVRISGATAPDNTFNGAFLLSPTAANPSAAAAAIFQDTTVRRFEGSASGDDFTITCGLPTAATVTANSDATAFVDSEGNPATLSTSTPLCVQKVAHGSGQGTVNVGDSIALNFADMTAIIDGSGAILGSSSCSAASTIVPASADQQTHELHTGCDVSSNFVPDCGVADVEPALFNQPASKFDSGSTIDLPWGMQASIPLYMALQAVQYAGTDCDPGEANYDTASAAAANQDNDLTDGVARAPACVPSISVGVIRSIFTNDLVLADELRDDNGNPLRLSPDVTSVGDQPVSQDDGLQTDDPLTGSLTAITASPGAGLVNPVPNANADGNHLVYLCRRKNSSGTQASYEAKFLRQRCEPGLQMASGNLPGSFNFGNVDNGGFADFLGSTGTLNVYENDGSSDVTKCMDQATVQNVWAIGINSTEKVSETESVQRDGWSHVKIDGVLPTSLNVTKGYHSFFSSIAGNTRAGEDSAGGAPELCREAVFDSASAAAVVSTLLPDFVHGWGQGGALASADKAVNNLPLATYAGGLTEAELAANPVNQFSVSTSGTLNNCAYPTKIPSPNLTDIIPAGAGEVK